MSENEIDGLTCQHRDSECGDTASHLIDFGDGSVGVYCPQHHEEGVQRVAKEGFLEDIAVRELTEDDHERYRTAMEYLGTVVGEEGADPDGLPMSLLADCFEEAAEFMRNHSWETTVDTTFGLEGAP